MKLEDAVGGMGDLDVLERDLSSLVSCSTSISWRICSLSEVASHHT